jgi:hypothetical protein
MKKERTEIIEHKKKTRKTQRIYGPAITENDDKYLQQIFATKNIVN